MSDAIGDEQHLARARERLRIARERATAAEMLVTGAREELASSVADLERMCADTNIVVPDGWPYSSPTGTRSTPAEPPPPVPAADLVSAATGIAVPDGWPYNSSTGSSTRSTPVESPPPATAPKAPISRAAAVEGQTSRRSAPADQQSAEKQGRWFGMRFGAATLFLLGLVSSAAQFIAASSFGIAEYFNRSDSSTGGAVAVIAGIAMWVRCRSWASWRKWIWAPIAILVVLAFIVMGTAAQTIAST